MPVNEVFRLGLVGGGRMGQTHIRALLGSSTVRIVAVAEPNETTATSLRSSGLAVHQSVAAMIAAGGVDGILIAAPTDQHLGIIEAIAGAGLPILCEKPCGISAAQARRAGEIAERNGVPLQVAYWRRFIPALRETARRIAAGEMGTVHCAFCAQWDETPPAIQFRAHSGGIFIDMGVHEIDQIRWLTGQEVTDIAISAFPTVEDPEAIGDVDSAQALLTLSGGTAAVVSLGRFHPGGDLVSAEVFASRDHVRIDVLTPDDGEAPQLEALHRQAEAFARWARGGAPEGATITDAVEALVIAEALVDAVARQRAGRTE